MKIPRATYVEKCAERWHGWALADARRNFADFEEIKDTLIDAMRSYRRDPFQRDIADKCLNPDGTLTAFLWRLQESITPDRSCLHPLLDFEESCQKVFLRRGLIAYCTLILREMETIAATPDPSLFHFSQPESQP